nr:Hsp20/alpha crystallin family protein [Candidatus Freyarchaeota archaeon]
MEPRRKRFWDLFGFDEMFGFEEIFQRMQEYVQKAAESGELSENSFTIPFEGPDFKGIIRYEYSNSNMPLNEQDIEIRSPLPEEPEPVPTRKPRRIRPEKPLDIPVQNTSQDTLVDLIEKPDELLVVAEVPAANRDDIKLNLTDRNLEIRVDSPAMFYKVIQLPCEVDCDSAKADFRNRILEIKIRKK